MHDLHQIYLKARATLKREMKELLLKDKFKSVDKWYREFEDGKFGETLLKLLLRIRKMVDAKSDVGKILTMIHHYNEKMNTLNSEIDSYEDPNAILHKYSELIRITSKILKKIATLKDDEHCMKRPFVLRDIRYDVCDDLLYNQIKKLRVRILKNYPLLEQCQEL